MMIEQDIDDIEFMNRKKWVVSYHLTTFIIKIISYNKL
jgi:hypothetical protein